MILQVALAAMSKSGCVFPQCEKKEDLSTIGSQRIASIIAASKARGDSVHLSLEKDLQENQDLQIQCHRTCVSTYTSKHHISRAMKRCGITQERSHSAPPARKRRSEGLHFEFKKHCIFCGEECLPRNKKNPSRWREVIPCRTVDVPGGKTLKDRILDKCAERGDALASEVRIRVLGAPSDLHAADAQYHKDCYYKFMPARNVQAAKVRHESDYSENFKNLIDCMNNEPNHVWTTVELHQRYKDLGEETLTRKQLVSKIQDHFGESLVKLDISGCASLLCFKDHLPGYLPLIKVNNSEETVVNAKIKDKIVSECMELPKMDDYDIGQFVKSKVVECTSPTLLSLVSSLVSGGEITKVSTTLAQSIQSHITHSYNQTTLGLAVKLHHKFGSKELITLLHAYGITSSYDEIVRFRKSVATYTANQPYTFRGLKTNGGTIGSWVDNYDLNVFTPNGCRETHALAIELTQHPLECDNEDDQMESVVIPRLSKEAISDIKLSELSAIDLQHYQGPKNPKPPITSTHDGIPYPEAVKRMEDLKEALKADVDWLNSVIHGHDGGEEPTEWSGFMCHLSREKGFVSKATRYVFGPLIDAPPSHPDTVLTSLMYIERFVRSHGQRYVHVVADLQLFKTAIQIKWSNPVRWKFLIIRPGGMHTLMSFLGCIGKLMKGSGLEEVLSAAYKGLTGVLNGKAWPKALRAFRMVVTELLRACLEKGKATAEAIEEELQSARSSKTAQLWIDCLIYPVILAHLFVRAEREGNFVLHMYCLTKMLPYFFAAGHWNYARYITYHVMEFQTQLDEEALAMFHLGHHVCRHRTGSWNAVFSDQFGEQTYIRYGKAKGGLVGLTLSQDQVTGWILSYHLCNTLSLAMDNMFQVDGDEEYEKGTDKHKEEGKRRKILDQEDRKKIRQELAKYPHPLQLGEPEVLLNIVNGHVAGEKVNVHDALAIGERMSAEFKGTLPSGFYSPIHSKVVTMETMKKGVKIGEKMTYDMEQLYGRFLIVSQTRDVTLEDMLSFELAPVPSAIFDDYGSLRKSTKSTLLHALAVWHEDMNEPDIQVMDGNEMLYRITWPKIGTVKNLLQNFTRAVEKREHDVIVVFDRYVEGSIKTHERLRRAGTTVCPTLSLTLDMCLPGRDIIMKSDNNKRELIKVICSANESRNVAMMNEENREYKHEEADCNIISYVKSLIIKGHKHIQVVADDTDIFTLLVYFCWKWQYSAQISMRKSDGRVVDITATAEKLGCKYFQLLAVHAITGCDTVSYFFGKGKVSAVSIMMKHDIDLEIIGIPDAELSDVIAAGRKFISILYKEKVSTTSMNKIRYTIFRSKRDTPKIKSLPPTDPALDEHIKRAHLQTMLWKSADEKEPPIVDICAFGWEIKDGIPVPCTGVSEVAPSELMKVIACGCSAKNACSRHNCSCHSAGLPCTSFCMCLAQESCYNPHTKQDEDSESEDSEQE